MSLKQFESKTYSINDFSEWNQRNQLELQPRFQRRSVWTDKARSFLMDTIIRGKPIPKIFIRQRTDLKSRQTIREVVDGQQRLRTILLFLDDGFSISRTHNPKYAGVLFSEMDEDSQRAILDYEISVDVLLGASDADVLDVFARLNSYAVVLNKQEMLNAEYFGEFKQAVYELSMEYASFWPSLGFISDYKMLRMADAELVSDLLIVMKDGIKAKSAVRRYYKELDDVFPSREVAMQRFRSVLDLGAEMMEGADSVFMQRAPLFYTMVCAICHMNYGLKDLYVPRVPLKKGNFARTREALLNLNYIFHTDRARLPKEALQFLTDSQRATTDEAVRIRRASFTAQKIADALLSSPE